uniref:Uncharacterized protein n=1 Tax=Meloidogyne hapla TaxID=6305 RepID=A0A1I8BKJ0_MELHA
MMKTTTSSSNIFDSVFCALHQQMDPEKTIFVNWDESAINQKPLGCVGEPFLFSRDLALIYTALNIPASELDIQKFARLPTSLISSSTTPSLTIFVPIKENKLKEEENKFKQIEKDKENYLNENNEDIILLNNEEFKNEGKELLNK